MDTQVLTSGGATADQMAVRRHNLSVVLSHLRRSGPRSRARIADETGLNKTTVSSLVAELAERGLVEEGDAERGGVGRPGQAIRLTGGHHFAVGSQINIDYVSALAMNLQGEVVSERRIPLDTARLERAVVLRQLAGIITGLVDRLQVSGARPVGVTVAVPGLVESATGTVILAPNLGWCEAPILQELTAMLGWLMLPIHLDNDANLAALAEMQTRWDDDSGHLLLLTGAVGVGGGLVSDGQLIRGSQGFAGEVGHMQIDPGGKTCGCGLRGCWETVIGLNALLARAADPEDPVRDPALDVLQRLEEVVARANVGDGRALEALAETARWTARGVGFLINIFDPEIIVLGGYFAVLGRWLTDPLRAALPERALAPEAGGCRLELSRLGFSAADRGGALRALSLVFADPTAVDGLRRSFVPAGGSAVTEPCPRPPGRHRPPG
jgi:predicted NBD/HSP70 family sugar kinase